MIRWICAIHTRVAEPIDVDLDAGPSQHGVHAPHVVLFDVIQENQLVREAHLGTLLSWVLLSEEGSASTHLVKCTIYPTSTNENGLLLGCIPLSILSKVPPDRMVLTERVGCQPK